MNAPATTNDSEWRRVQRCDAHARGLCRFRDSKDEGWRYGVLIAVDYSEIERPFVVRVGTSIDCWRFCEVQA